MNTNPQSALAFALIAGAVAGDGMAAFPLPFDTDASSGRLMLRPTRDPTPAHCPRCGAPMVRVREDGGAYAGAECAVCAADNFGLSPCRDMWPARYDGRDWRRLMRWMALRGRAK